MRDNYYTVVSRVSAHGCLNITHNFDLHGCLHTWDINCICLYRSDYMDPFEYGTCTWVLAQDSCLGLWHSLHNCLGDFYVI